MLPNYQARSPFVLKHTTSYYDNNISSPSSMAHNLRLTEIATFTHEIKTSKCFPGFHQTVIYPKILLPHVDTPTYE